MTDDDRRHPDFEEGNTHALVHGARSPGTVSALAGQIKQRLRVAPDWPAQLNEPRFADAVDDYTDALAILWLLRAQLDRESVEDWITDRHDETSTTATLGQDKTRRRTRGKRRSSVLPQVDRWQTTVARRRADLGLTPVAEAKLDRNVVVAAAVRQDTLGSLQESGRRTVSASSERVRELYVGDGPDQGGEGS